LLVCNLQLEAFHHEHEALVPCYPPATSLKLGSVLRKRRQWPRWHANGSASFMPGRGLHESVGGQQMIVLLELRVGLGYARQILC
jgi:hypothetical protein